MTDVVLLVNPAAGSGRGMAYSVVAADKLREGGCDVEVLVGRSGEHAAELAARAVARQVPRLAVCGGDGLVHSAVQAAAQTSTALGIVPAGTGNDIARALGLPRGDPKAAAHVIASREPRSIDLGQVGDRWFVSVLAAGFDSRVNDRANRMSWPHGRLCFNAAMVAELPAFRPVPIRLELDRQAIQLRAMLVAVGNGSSYGGGMRICPGADLHDGLFDITVVTAISTAKLIRLFPQVYSGRHVRRSEVLTFRSSRVRIEAAGFSAYADGEPVGNVPLTAHVIPDALRVLS